jgi:hypothetical protein
VAPPVAGILPAYMEGLVPAASGMTSLGGVTGVIGAVPGGGGVIPAGA